MPDLVSIAALICALVALLQAIILHHQYLDLWSYDGTLDRIHHALYVECQ